MLGKVFTISPYLEVKSKIYSLIYRFKSTGIDEKYHKKVIHLFETLDENKCTRINVPSISFILEMLGGSIDLIESK